MAWYDGGHWVTLEDGQHVLIEDGTGIIMAGLGPQNNGKTFAEAFDKHSNIANALNPNAVRRANDMSSFNAGDRIQRKYAQGLLVTRTDKERADLQRISEHALDVFSKTLPDSSLVGPAKYNQNAGFDSADKRLNAEMAITNYISSIEAAYIKEDKERIKLESRTTNKQRLEEAEKNNSKTVELLDDLGSPSTFYKRGKGWSAKHPKNSGTNYVAEQQNFGLSSF